MIWAVVSKDEMGSSTSSPTFDFYSSELGKERVRLAVVDESDCLDFISNDDVVLLRTASESLIDRIKEIDVRTTAEMYDTYRLALDKNEVAKYLITRGVKMAPCYEIDEVVENKTYFVKPRYGNDSGVSLENICRSKEEIKRKIEDILSSYGQDSIICDNLEGEEYTVACVSDGVGVLTYPLDVDNVTRKLPQNIMDRLREKSIKVFEEAGIIHHARIDFRADVDGNIFVIDINLIPSLGPNGKWAKCFELSGLSYRDSLESIIKSASKLK